MPLQRDDSAEQAAKLRAEKQSVIAKCLVTMYAAYDRVLPEGNEKNIRVGAWMMALEEMTPLEIRNAFAAEMRNRTSEYMPKPPDILRRWKGEEIEFEGKKERVTVANASAYQPLQPTANELAMRNALPGGMSDGRREWEELRGKLHSLRLVTKNAARIAPHDERSLSNALHDFCDMQCWRVKRELWTAFGWWLLERYPIADWTNALAKEQWAIWQTEQASKAPVETVN